MLILSILLMGITGGVLPYLPVYRTLDAQVIMTTVQIVMMMMMMMMRRRMLALVMIMMKMDVVVRLAWLALMAVALATFLGKR